MREKADKPNVNEELSAARKKLKRIEESRTAIKTKSRKKGETIKAYQDRESELKQNRDDWRGKCKQQEQECIEIEKKYKQMAELFEMKEEEVKDILREFDELKKKYPPKPGRQKV